jgi:hypothetical protein
LESLGYLNVRPPSSFSSLSTFCGHFLGHLKIGALLVRTIRQFFPQLNTWMDAIPDPP